MDGSQSGHCNFTPFFLWQICSSKNIYLVCVLFFSVRFRPVSFWKNGFSPTSQLFCRMNHALLKDFSFYFVAFVFAAIEALCCSQTPPCLVSIILSIQILPPKNLHPTCESGGWWVTFVHAIWKKKKPGDRYMQTMYRIIITLWLDLLHTHVYVTLITQMNHFDREQKECNHSFTFWGWHFKFLCAKAKFYLL